MKIYQLLFIALVAVSFNGCSGAAVEPQVISPTDTLKNFVEASKKKDVEAIKKTVSKNSLIMVESSAKAQNTTADELLGRDNPALPNEIPEIRNERIEGETASVEVKDEKGGYDTIPFVKEDGAWKIAFDKYQQALMEKMRQEMGNMEKLQQNVSNTNSNSSKSDGDQKSPAPANKPNANK